MDTVSGEASISQTNPSYAPDSNHPLASPPVAAPGADLPHPLTGYDTVMGWVGERHGYISNTDSGSLTDLAYSPWTFRRGDFASLNLGR